MKWYVAHWKCDPVAAFLDTVIAVLLLVVIIKYGVWQ